MDTRSDAAEVESRKRVTALVSAWREAQPAPHKLSEQHTAFSPTSSTGSFQQENPNPILLWIKQTSTLTNRALLCNWRDVPQTAGFAAQFIILSVIIGLAFYNPPQDPGGIQTMKTALFQVTSFSFCVPAASPADDYGCGSEYRRDLLPILPYWGLHLLRSLSRL